VGDYSSYCRTVKSEKISNKKKKGKGNQKNGNKYLAWVCVEAANHAIWNYPEFRRFYNQERAERNKIVAIKALSNKLARASFYVMRDQVPYDETKLFRT
jgi:transposase